MKSLTESSTPSEDICLVWNSPCPHTEKCLRKNKNKVDSILNLKNTFKNNDLSNIAELLLANIRSVFKESGIHPKKVSAIMHYLNNGVGAHFDNHIIVCDNSDKPANAILKRYIKNVFKLERFYNDISHLSDEKLHSFAEKTYQMFINNDYLSSISKLNKLLK